jgi:adenylate cyclase
VEGLNQQLGTQVLATAAAVEGLDELLLRPLGRFVFVGKQAPLPVMELVAYRSDATHAQRESCDRFAAALDAFEARRWDQAQAQFEAFASIDKTDQISRIYLQLCREYRAVEPQIEDPGAIILDHK